MKTDIELQQDVVAELAWEPSIRDGDITIEVRDGVVTMTGTVDDYVQRRAAEVTAGRVAGVRAVVQDLSVHVPIAHDRSDTDIGHQAVKGLEWDSEVPHDDIQVFVENGWLSLTGTVQHDFQRRAAERVVSRLHGVRGIRNLIELVPHASAREVEKHIKAALHRSAESDARHIVVKEQNGHVTLSGNVHSWAERDDAERAAWSTSGVTNVDDRITVTF